VIREPSDRQGTCTIDETMVNDPYDPEPPFEYECVDCSQRFGPDDLDRLAAGDELIACPECGGDVWNLTTPSHE
jgi:DNA-directed RNA polymerase subunit RPC12/RpoP